MSKYSDAFQRVLSPLATIPAVEKNLVQDGFDDSERYEKLDQVLANAQHASDRSLNGLLERNDFDGAFRSFGTENSHDKSQ